MANEEELTSEFGGEVRFLPPENITTTFVDTDGNEIPDVCDACKKNRSCMCIQGNNHLVKYCWDCWKREQEQQNASQISDKVIKDAWVIEI